MAAQAAVHIAGDTLAVSGVLDCDSISAVDAEGQQWLRGAAPSQCSVDLSGITYSSSVGIALLLAWLRIAAQQQKHLQLRNLPASMAALAKVGGLETVLS